MNFFTNTECVDRLYQEYKKHKRLVVAVDFDDTIFDFHSRGTNFNRIVSAIKRCKERNFYIVIFTASSLDRFVFIQEYCKEIGVEIDCINTNPIPLKYGNNGCKIFYNILLDDRAGLGQALETLEVLLNKIDKKEMYLQ